MKKHKIMKVWEKIFILSSVFIIITIIGIYTYRAFYYYRLEHPKIDEDQSLMAALINKSIIVQSGSGVYKTDQTYYFKGEVNNNYVKYSGRLWRVIDYNENVGIKLITEENQTTLVWGIDNNYNNSYIYKWLNKTEEEYSGIFLDSLYNYEQYLTKSEWCIGEATTDKINCEETVNDYVGLISIEEYLNVGANDSYLNNESYFWTTNSSDNNKIWFVSDNGKINDNSYNGDNYFSYGVRPSIMLKTSVKLINGNGTKENPYLINERKVETVSQTFIGDNVKIGNTDFKVIENNDKYIKLLSTNTIETKTDYSPSIIYSSDNIIYKTLEKELLSEENNELLVNCDIYGGGYNSDNNYNYIDKYKNKNKISVKFGIPSVGDFFINETDGIWLSNYESINNELVYITNNNGGLFADSKSNKNNIKGIICINKDSIITEGNGSETYPYTMEEK